MTQENSWEREYRESKFLTKDNKPQADVVRFVKFLKKLEKINVEGLSVLDLGSGAGRNSYYFAELGAEVTGYEISDKALEIAREQAGKENFSFPIVYVKQSIGEIFPYGDSCADIVLDVTSSNSLSEKERETYLSETHRVMWDGGYFFTKALCKDGDENAKYLLKHNPGGEVDTYILPDLNIFERVWSREDFVKTYEKYFKILFLEKKTTYTKMDGRSYKRNFWIAYMKK